MGLMANESNSKFSSFLNWLDRLPDWRFTSTLYLLRWLVIVPISLVLWPFSSSAAAFHGDGDPWEYLLPFLVVAPTLETLIECTLPYWVLNKVLNVRREPHWPFVFVSATAMVVLHPLVPTVIVFAFITGAFLAYVYAHFAPTSHLKAFLHTAVFHAGINLVGWTMIFVQSLT